MESALDVLSRAATMVQDNANETRLTSKELPTTAWRRERRLRTGEYHMHQHNSPGSSSRSLHASSPSSSPPPTAHIQHSTISPGSVSNTNTNLRSTAHHLSIMMAAAASMRPLNHPPPSPPLHSNLAGQTHFGHIPHSQALPHINSAQNDDVPLDMSVANLKQRNSPPPPYREPLPGSQFASSLARPSVITQAPPKRDVGDSILAPNRENDNRSCESIDEHFRRSLGNDYFSLFSKRSPVKQSTKTPSPLPNNAQLPLLSYAKSSSPTSPLIPGAPTLPPQSILMQSELVPPPAYPGNLPSGHHQENSQQAHQNQALATPKANNALSSPGTLAAQMKIAAVNDSPPLPLVVRPNVLQNHQHNRVLQRSSGLITATPLASPQPSAPNTGVKLCSTISTPIFNMSGSRTASPLPSASSVTMSHLASLENSPSSSPRHTPPAHNVPVQNPPPNLPAIMRIKTEPGLQSLKSNNPTPPASPTSTTNQNINSSSTSNSSNISSPSSPQTTTWKTSKPSNTSAEVLASVDDHFAKALGDTWKKLQEGKEMRK